MGSLALIVKRARAGIGLLVTILALTAATTAIIAGTLGYSQAAATTAARQALTDAVPTEAGIRVQTRLAEDPDAQDTAARRIIDEAFAPAPIRVQRTLVSEPRSVQDQDDRLVAVASTALLSDDPDFAGRVDLVEGSWPSGPGEGGTVPGALHAAAAERLGVGVADTLSVGEVTVTVEALWRPVDPQAAFWFGDPLVAGGGSDGEAGPLVVHPDAIASLGGTPFARWTVQPDAESIEPDDLPLLASAASGLQDDMRTPEVEVRGVTVEGDLAPTTATAASNLATARALNVVPVAVLLLVSVIAIVQIARLLAQSRSGEVELLIARGADRGQVWRWNLVESVVLVALATTLGIAGGVGVVRLVPAGDQQGGEVTRAGLLTGLAVLVALAVIALLQVRALAARSATDRSGRTRQVAAIGTLVLTLGAAALAWWQLRRYGSPLVTDTDGSTDTDLLAGAAPALLLASVAVVAMALLGPLGRLMEALTRPTRRLAGHLASSQVSRRLVVYAVPVVLTVLAVGATTLSSLYAATSAGLRNDLSALGQGAEVSAQVDQQVGSTPPATLPVGVDTGGLAGLRASAPVWRTDTRIGSTDTQLTVIPADRMTEVMLVPDSLDLAGLAQTLRPSDFAGWGAVEVPEGSTELTLDLSVQTSIPAETVESLEEALTFTDADLERENPDLSEDELARLSGRIQANLDEQLVAWGTTWGMPAVAWVEDSLTGRIHRVALDPTEV
ncbi:MAG: hypothetical protein M3424_10630, partial [Actinomycetota bacterium]|nr:hypothetical protein [Actinomycetota bacterium]